MGFFDRLRDGLGTQRPAEPTPSADDQAIARYRYLLRTAPPETLEQSHAEAFAQLTPEQRQRVLRDLADATPEGGERAAVLRAGDDPGGLARAATRAELRQPGVLERILGRAGPAVSGGGYAPAAPGMGAMLGGTLLASMAGTVLGSVIAQQFLHANPPAAGLFGDGNANLPQDAPAFWRDAGAPVDEGASADAGDSAGDGGVADLGDDVDSGFDGGSFDV